VNKCFAILLLLLVVVGSFVPCCAEDNCETEPSTVASGTGHHNDRDDDGSGCSPFFACGTCAPAVITFSAVQAPLIPAPQQDQYGFTCPDRLLQYHPSFFKPPRG